MYASIDVKSKNQAAKKVHISALIDRNIDTERDRNECFCDCGK